VQEPFVPVLVGPTWRTRTRSGTSTAWPFALSPAKNAPGVRVAITCSLEAIPGGPQMRLVWRESDDPPVICQNRRALARSTSIAQRIS